MTMTSIPEGGENNAFGEDAWLARINHKIDPGVRVLVMSGNVILTDLTASVDRLRVGHYLQVRGEISS